MKLKELKKGDFFRIVTKAGTGRKTYTKGEYDRVEKKYLCGNYEDINDYKYFKPTQEVTTEFIY